MAGRLATQRLIRGGVWSDGQLPRFDTWLARTADRVEITSADVSLAAALLRRLDLTLRTFDATHIAISQRINATLVNFDQLLAASARAPGMAVATP